MHFLFQRKRPDNGELRLLTVMYEGRSDTDMRHVCLPCLVSRWLALSLHEGEAAVSVSSRHDAVLVAGEAPLPFSVACRPVPLQFGDVCLVYIDTALKDNVILIPAESGKGLGKPVSAYRSGIPVVVGG